MGGNVPLGYDASEGALVINAVEAEMRTKRRVTAYGAARGGKPFSRGHLYRLLSNPIYAGQIAHKGQLFQGQHPALIDNETWAVVRDRLAAAAGDHRHKTKSAEPSLLTGLLVDARASGLRHPTRSRKADAIAITSPPP